MSAKWTRARWGALLGLALYVGCCPVLLAAEAVGAVSSLRPKATQAPPRDAVRELSLNAAIFRSAELETAPQGALEVTFKDNSKLSMGGSSRVVVDDYVYGAPSDPSRQSLKYTKGAFRFISGSMPKDRVRVETPTVTIGIRGTTLRTLVTDDGTTTVGLDHGEAVVTSKRTGQSVTLRAGEKVTIKASGELGSVELGKVEGCP